MTRANGKPRIRLRAMALLGAVCLILSVAGCAGGVVSYSGYVDEDDGPAFDYDSGFYGPGELDYGWWDGGYFGGPPIYGYRGGGRWHPGHGGRPYRAAPPSRGMPSIPSGPRGGGMRGGGGPHGGGHR